jgi:hypothetical protein
MRTIAGRSATPRAEVRAGCEREDRAPAGARGVRGGAAVASLLSAARGVRGGAAVASLLSAALVASLAGAPALAAPREPARIELAPHTSILTVALEDLDGDGDIDPVVASARATGPRTTERYLTFYRVKNGAAEQTRQERVPDDVVAFALGDFAESPGRDLLYITAQSVFVVGAGGPRSLLSGQRLMFTMASAEALPYWHGVADLDRDGRDDLMLPDPDGYQLYRQTEKRTLVGIGAVDAEFEFAQELPARLARIASDSRSVVTRRVLRSVFPARLDADDRLDLVTLREDTVVGFAQQGDGTFQAAPTAVRRLVSPRSGPVFGRPEISASPAIQYGDADSDGRVDFVVPEQDVKELVTRLRIFLSGSNKAASTNGSATKAATDGPAAMPAEPPSQVIKLSSITLAPELVDINGDGYLDLGCTTFRSDRLLSFSGGPLRSLDFTHYVFLFQPETGLFATRPDLSIDASWELREDAGQDAREESDEDGAVPTARASERPIRERAPRVNGFIRMTGDFDGDGVHDAALYRDAKVLEIRPGSASGAGKRNVSVAGEPFLRAEVPPMISADFVDLDGNGKDDAVLVYPGSVLLLVSP